MKIAMPADCGGDELEWMNPMSADTQVEPASAGFEAVHQIAASTDARDRARVRVPSLRQLGHDL
jgi:hypothetical protein